MKAALARHGIFSTDAHAMAFVVEYLKREERKIDKYVRLPELSRHQALNTRGAALLQSVPVRHRARSALH